MTNEEAIELLETYDFPEGDPRLAQAAYMGAAALREELGDGVALTLEELREMEGEPVWLIGEGLARYDIFCGETTDHIAQFYKEALPAWAYGRTWRAYRRKPEEGTA